MPTWQNVYAACLFIEHPRDLFELPVGYGIAFARRAENVDVTKAKCEKLLHFTAEHIFEETVLLIPWNFATDQNTSWIAGFDGCSH